MNGTQNKQFKLNRKERALNQDLLVPPKSSVSAICLCPLGIGCFCMPRGVIYAFHDHMGVHGISALNVLHTHWLEASTMAIARRRA